MKKQNILSKGSKKNLGGQTWCSEFGGAHMIMREIHILIILRKSSPDSLSHP